MTISIAITTIVFTFMIGSTHITRQVSGEFVGTIHVILWIFLVISICALAVTLLLRRAPAGQA